VVPWFLADSHHLPRAVITLVPQRTVFVGALHGLVTAHGLAMVFEELFGPVEYALLDTDQHGYPSGSGRVAFLSPDSHLRAVLAGAVTIHTPGFRKKVQVDPFLVDSPCLCRRGSYFCRSAGDASLLTVPQVPRLLHLPVPRVLGRAAPRGRGGRPRAATQGHQGHLPRALGLGSTGDRIGTSV
jgi:hypothetical protein